MRKTSFKYCYCWRWLWTI